jgi:hypothetical protein
MLKWQESMNDIKQIKVLHGLFKNLNILIKQCNVSWDASDIDESIIKLVCDILNNSHKQQDSRKLIYQTHVQQQSQQQLQSELFDREFDKLILLFLNISNNIINHTEQMRQFCIRNLKYNELIFLLSRKCPLIKLELLLVVNSSFEKGDNELKMRLCDIMHQISVKQLLSNTCMSLQHEHGLFKNLAILQKNTLDIKCVKMMSEYNREKCLETLKIICEISFKPDMQNDET